MFPFYIPFGSRRQIPLGGTCAKEIAEYRLHSQHRQFLSDLLRKAQADSRWYMPSFFNDRQEAEVLRRNGSLRRYSICYASLSKCLYGTGGDRMFNPGASKPLLTIFLLCKKGNAPRNSLCGQTANRRIAQHWKIFCAGSPGPRGDTQIHI